MPSLWPAGLHLHQGDPADPQVGAGTGGVVQGDGEDVLAGFQGDVFEREAESDAFGVIANRPGAGSPGLRA